MVSSLLNPVVTIVEEDCGTMLGLDSEVTYTILGRTPITSLTPLTKDQIDALLIAGTHQIDLRSLRTCASDNGVCRTCYNANYLVNNAPAVGELVTLKNVYLSANDTTRGNGTTGLLLPSLSDIDNVGNNYSVLVDTNVVVDPSTYSLVVGEGMYLNSGFTKTVDVYSMHYFREETSPFLGYIASTFSGGLLGLSQLPTSPLLIKPSLYASRLTNSYLSTLLRELADIPAVPLPYIEYGDTIGDPLEKALFIAYTFYVYSGVLT
jgi:hypothetical protein